MAATDPTEIERLRRIYDSRNDEKNKSLIATAGFGAAYLTVLVWNIFDLNNVLPSELDLQADVRINKGMLEASIAF